MIHPIFKVCLALLILSEASFAAIVAKASKKIAVLETTGDPSFSQEEKNYITDKIRERAVTILPPNQNYEVMSRDGILTALPSGKSLEKCDGKCLTEIGKKISANYVCQAKISQVFGQYAVNLELYETASGKLLGSFTQRQPSIEALLADIEKESDRLFKIIAPTKGKDEKSEVKQASATNTQSPSSDYVEDYQGNRYRTVTIKNQTWMAENLRTETETSSCYNNDKKNCETFGRLYSWDAAKKICPQGWSLPRKPDYEILMDAGIDNLKSTIGWPTIDGKSRNGSDKYKFSILPSGYNSGISADLGRKAYFWTSTPRSHGYAWYLQIGTDSWDMVSNLNSHKMSVRCIKNP